MNENSDIHWTDNDELLTQYVLHQLPAGEEDRLSAHLAGCEKCRRTVSEERRFAVLMKQAGRSQLKRRLKSRLELMAGETSTAEPGRMPVRHIPWVRIAGIAAAVVIIISVGVYNNWLTTDYRTINTPTHSGEQLRGFPDSTARRLDSEGSSGRLKAPSRTDLLSKKDHDKQLISGGNGQGIKKAPSRQEISRDENQKANAAAPGVKGEAELSTRQTQMKEALPLTDQAMSQPEPQYWVKGHILPEAPAGNFTGAPSNRMYSSSDQGNMRAKAGIQSDMMLPIFLKQKPSSSLPSSIQNEGPGTIQTLIEDHIDGIQVILFLDSPLADSDLESAKFTILHNDSLIVHLLHQKIGLTIPPSLSEKVNSSLKR